jgi:hypothetical protein
MLRARQRLSEPALMPPRPGRSSASLLVRLLGAAALCAASLAVCLPARAQEVAVIQVRLPDPLSPAARSVKYTEPLDGALRREGLGRVLGGSTELSRDRRIVSVGMEIEVRDLDHGVPFVRRALRELGAPQGSMVEFERFGLAVELPVHE